MLTFEEITDFLCEMVLHAFKEECIRGNDATEHWRTASQFNLLINKLPSTDQSLINKFDCLASKVPPKCLPVFVSQRVNSTCDMAVGVEITNEETGNPCDDFNVRLSII